jgi:hypothetical protein
MARFVLDCRKHLTAIWLRRGVLLSAGACCAAVAGVVASLLNISESGFVKGFFQSSVGGEWCLVTFIKSSSTTNLMGLTLHFDTSLKQESDGSVRGAAWKVFVNHQRPYPAEVSRVDFIDGSYIKHDTLLLIYREISNYHTKNTGYHVTGKIILREYHHIWTGQLESQPSSVRGAASLVRRPCESMVRRH